MTDQSKAGSRPLHLDIDLIARGALAVSVISFATTLLLLEVLYVLIAVNTDNVAIKKMGFAHQSYAIDSVIILSFIFDAVFLPVMFYTVRAYLQLRWKMALFASLVWIGQIVFTTSKWQSLPNPSASIPSDAMAVILLGYLAVRWRRMKAQA